jgi:hypothetical protein
MIEAILSRAAQAGIRLWVEDDQLHYRMPPGAVAPEIFAELRAHKPGVISHLKNRDRATAKRAADLLYLTDTAQNASFLPMRIENLWRAEGFAATVPFHLAFPIALGTAVDLPALRDAITLVVSRHDALRTILVRSGERPQMSVQGPASPDLDSVEISRAILTAHREGVDSIITDFIDEPIDLLREPGFRVRAFRDEDANTIVFVKLHHYFAEAWSAQILRREILSCYGAFKERKNPELPQIITQFGAYGRAQRQFLSEKLDDHLAYWQNRLGALPASRLAYDFVKDTGRIGRLFFALDEGLMDGINALSRDCRATPAIILLSAFQILLAGWSEQQRVATAVNMADRAAEDLRNTVGYLIASVAIASDIGPDIPVRTLFSEVASTFHSAYLYRTLSYDLYERVVQPSQPFCPSLFNFVPLQVMPSQGKDRAPLNNFSSIVPARDVQRVKVQRELYLNLNELPGGAAGKTHYNLDFFAEATIVTLIEGFKLALQEIVTDPNRSIGAIQRRIFRRGASAAGI